MRLVLSSFLFGLLIAGTTPEEARAEVSPGALTAHGFSGLLATPDATVLGEGQVGVGYSRLRLKQYPDDVDSFAVNLGVLPFMEFSGRLVHGKDSVISDLSASAKLRLPGSLLGRHIPDLAIGAQDVGSAAPHFRSRYVVVSETLGPARLSVGYGFGPDRMDGVFGGAEVWPTRWLRFLGDYDAEAASLGMGLRIPVLLLAMPIEVGATVWGAVSEDKHELDVAFSVTSPLGGGLRTPLAGVAEPEVEAPGLGGDLQAPFEEVADALVEAGFENVRVGVKAGRVAYAEVEDNRFSWNELDGLGVALGIVAGGAPRELDWIVIVQRKTGLALRELWLPRWPFVAYLEGKGGRERLEQELDVSPCLSTTSDVVFATLRRNASYGKLRVTLAPKIQTVVGSESTPFGYVLSVKPEVTATLWAGAVVHAAWEVPFAWSREFDDGGVFRLDRRAAHTEHAMLYQGAPIAPGLVGLVGVGLFRSDKGGGLGELAWASPDGFVWLRGFGGYFRDRFDRQFSSALGSARVWVPWIDGSLEVTGGRFFYGDLGGGVELARFFGHTELGVYYQRSDVEVAGARVALPLTPRRGMRPGRVQVRGATRWRYDQITAVDQAANTFHPHQGVLPQTSYTVRDEYQNAGRLGSDYVRAHLARIREAYLRWGRPSSAP